MSEYFLTSGDKIRAFLEENYQSLQAEGSKKIFNKIGHALHAFNPVFKEITFDKKVQVLFKMFHMITIHIILNFID